MSIKRFVIILIIALITSMLVYAFLNEPRENIVKLDSKIELVSEIDHKQKFNFIIQPLENKEQEITFYFKNDVTVVLDHKDTKAKEIPQGALVYDIPIREYEETITLKPDEKLVYTIEIDLAKLTPGKYELEIRFSAGNVEVDDQSVEIIVN